MKRVIVVMCLAFLSCVATRPRETGAEREARIYAEIDRWEAASTSAAEKRVEKAFACESYNEARKILSGLMTNSIVRLPNWQVREHIRKLNLQHGKPEEYGLR